MKGMTDADVCERIAVLGRRLDAALLAWRDAVALLDGEVRRACSAHSPQVQRSSAALDAAAVWVQQVRYQARMLTHNMQALSAQRLQVADVGLLTRTMFYPEES